jgi:hypothetical protein
MGLGPFVAGCGLFCIHHGPGDGIGDDDVIHCTYYMAVHVTWLLFWHINTMLCPVKSNFKRKVKIQIRISKSNKNQVTRLRFCP